MKFVECLEFVAFVFECTEFCRFFQCKTVIAGWEVNDRGFGEFGG